MSHLNDQNKPFLTQMLGKLVVCLFTLLQLFSLSYPSDLCILPKIHECLVGCIHAHNLQQILKHKGYMFN